MLKPKPLGVAAKFLNLGGLMASLRHESEKADADPFDDALVAAVIGAAEAMKAESAAMTGVRKRIVQLARG